MIFRRSNDLPASKATPSSRTGTNTSRREPEITPRAGNGPSASQVTAPLTLSQSTPLNNTMARRGPASPAASFSRTEQLRKLTVGRDISLNGEITTCDHLIVEGNVAATIKGGQVLEISETGTFSGLVDIEEADIAGVFDGELTVRGKLILRPSAVVTGLVHYGRLQVDAGATLNGQINALPAQNPTQGNGIPTQNHGQTPTGQTTPTATNPISTNPATSYGSGSSLASVNDQPGFLKASA